MARKTDGEKIDELKDAVAQLTERLQNGIDDLNSFEDKLTELARSLADLRREDEKDIALLKRELEELKKWKDEQKKEHDEWGRRAWAFGPNVIGAVVSGIIAALVAYFISRH